VIVVEWTIIAAERRPLLAAPGAHFGHLVQASEQPFGMIGLQPSMRAWELVHAFVNRAERARAALLVELAATSRVAADAASACDSCAEPPFNVHRCVDASA